MNDGQFFMALAGSVLAALLGGWLASLTQSVARGLMVCVALAVLIALAVLQLSLSADTQGFAALLVIGAFMFSLVISAGSSMAMRRLRQARHDKLQPPAPDTDGADRNRTP